VNLKGKLTDNWRSGLAGSAGAFFFSLFFLMTPLGTGLRDWSYDLPLDFLPEPKIDKVVVVSMDEASHTALRQRPGQEWNRALHALLLQALNKRGATAVVFDILFDQPWAEKPADPVALGLLTNEFRLPLSAVTGSGVDDFFGGAIRQSAAKVILSASHEESKERGVEQHRFKSPLGVLGTNLNIGVTEFPGDLHQGVREHNRDPRYEGLAWKVAEVLGCPLPPDRTRARWIRFYGRKKTLPSVSYRNVFQPDALAPSTFSNKVVFVGKAPVKTAEGTTTQDALPTPFTRWGGGDTPGVEIQATAFLNFYRGDWLRQLPWWGELLLSACTALLAGLGLVLVRPWLAARAALLGIGVVALSEFALVWATRYWFSWLIVSGIQIPTALLWAVVNHTKKLHREKSNLEESLATARQAGFTPVNEKVDPTDVPTQVAGPGFDVGRALRPGEPTAPLIPDHTLIRCIGKGAYGEVWLARDIIGTYHAVKVVYRHSFSSEGPFIREFTGVQKFTPVSRSHPGLVQILHVGRREEAGYFYCIMEIGDDERSGPVIDPARYTPRNLAREVARRGRLPARECVSLGLALSEALNFLHQKGLIHRDIKPSNIIFVEGRPKFADIGLVTDLATPGEEVTFLGTEGFIAPEGPGTTSADVYSLGKLLYEASMGRDRKRFPELPTTMTRRADQEALLTLNEIILKACETDVTARYQTAAELLADLLRLKTVLDPEPAE
jgi:CHASE2 domain-containing sensor protein